MADSNGRNSEDWKKLENDILRLLSGLTYNEARNALSECLESIKDEAILREQS